VTVLDASAALAFLQGEPGEEAVRDHLPDSVIGSANLAEVLGKVGGALEGRLAEAILVSSGVRVEPVVVEDARLSARMRTSIPGLSLGARLCLALAERLDDVALTADRAWGRSDRVRQIR